MKTAPAPNRNITPAGPQRQNPPAGRVMPGTIEGFVYWDTHAVSHKPAGTCDGFTVSVIAGGSVQQAASGQFGAKYIGQVKSYLLGGKIVAYDVCTYAYGNVSENVPLRVELNITQPNSFSTAVAPATPIIGPVTIINAQCNMLPNIVTATLADLTAHWGSCQNMAFDVNFQLTPASLATRAAMLSPGTRALAQTAGAPGNANNPSSGGTLLAPGSNATLLGRNQQTAGGGTSSGLQPLVPRNGTNGTSSTSSGSGSGGGTTLQPLVPRGGSGGGGAAKANGQGSGGPGGSSAGQCTVTRLRFRFATSNDDLRGGKDNLNIIVFFAGGRAAQFAPNVNKSANWPNNSVNYVDVYLNQPVAPDQIRALRFVHIADGGFNAESLRSLLTPAAPIEIAEAFKSPDNWNMADVEVAAIGNGVGARIANHGFFRFTGSDPVLTFGVRVPANVCGSGRPTSSGDSGSGSGAAGGNSSVLNPGGTGLHPVTGGKSGAIGAEQAAKSPSSAGTLLTPGSQETLLGGGSVQSAPGGTSGSGQTTTAPAATMNGGSKSGSATAASKAPGRSEYGPMTADRGMTQDPGFVNWANSRAGSLTAARAPAGIRENPNLYVAQACAKDSSFRVLFIAGTSDGKTLTAGHYTLWGCSFGAPPQVKPQRPANALSQNATAVQQSLYAIAIYSAPLKIAWFVYADVVSWSDNSIVISVSQSAATYPHASLGGMVVPAELWVTRFDGQTTIYGHEGGLYFKPAN